MPGALGRKALRLAAATVFIAVATVLLLEVLVRLTMPQPAPANWLVPDARYGHLMKPDFHQRYTFAGTDFVMDVRTNALGLRDEELAPKEPGVPTVLFLGDSFTFGHGINIDDRFDRRLSRKLSASGVRVRSINAGVNAWGTLQETRFAEDHFNLFAPDIIVLTFHDNDPSDDSFFLERGVSFDQVRFPGKVLLRNHAHLFRLVQDTYLRYLKTHYFNDKAAKKQAEEGVPKAPAEGLRSAIIASEWRRTAAYIEAFAKAFRAHNPGGTVYIQSTRPELHDVAEHLKPLDNGDSIRFVDLVESFRGLSPEARRLPYDPHWSPAAHEASAVALYGALAPRLGAGGSGLGSPGYRRARKDFLRFAMRV